MQSIERVGCDTRRLSADIHRLVEQCVFFKRQLGARWTRSMAEEQRSLAHVRRKLTARLVLLAASRGRLHVRNLPIEDVRAIALRLASEYEVTP